MSADGNQKVNPETAAYFEGLQAGKLLLKRCTACGEAHYYPRARCPFCFGETQWQEAAGTGKVYSYSAVTRGGATHVLAYVTLTEGPTILTNIVDTEPAAIGIDMPVRLRIVPDKQGCLVPMFAP